MTRHLLVGYLATSTGRDALNLGIALAREQDARLHVVMIAPLDSAYAGIYPPAGGYGNILEEQLGAWLDEALATVPDDVPATGHVVTAESDAEGLLAAAEQLGCSMIIIGGRSGGLLRRYRLGSVATTLLHTAPIPVALAPAGYEHSGPVGRLTAMFGPRPGAVDVVGLGIQAAGRRSIPLRLVSLVLLDRAEEGSGPGTAVDDEDVLASVTQYANRRLADEAAEMLDQGRATTLVASGPTVDHAMAHLEWEPDDVVIVGSSRLAARGRLFLGSTAAKMLRTVPVPVVVVPAGHTGPATAESDH
ncbi:MULTISPECIES: universal stress protein [Citricoccus]|uniref:universal stress protein n=1 Tax=Citricoccus TaxID=169133 RepID=UPI000255E09D|nr:universal stress protein [Citricoccus sp. CH26A]